MFVFPRIVIARENVVRRGVTYLWYTLATIYLSIYIYIYTYKWNYEPLNTYGCCERTHFLYFKSYQRTYRFNWSTTRLRAGRERKGLPRVTKASHKAKRGAVLNKILNEWMNDQLRLCMNPVYYLFIYLSMYSCVYMPDILFIIYDIISHMYIRYYHTEYI